MKNQKLIVERIEALAKQINNANSLRLDTNIAIDNLLISKLTDVIKKKAKPSSTITVHRYCEVGSKIG